MGVRRGVRGSTGRRPQARHGGLEACQAAAKAEGFPRLALGSTLPGVPLYERFGFVATGDMTVSMPDGTKIAAVAMDKPIP